MIIRAMTDSDRAAIGELYAASWKAGYAGLLPKVFLDALEPNKYEERSLENGFLETGSFVAIEGDRIIGHVHARPAAEEKMNGWGEIHTLYVHPDHWRNGIGSALLKYAVEWLHSEGFSDIYLYVLIGNDRAAALYRKLGFTPNGDMLDCDIAGERVTDLRFTLHLEK